MTAARYVVVPTGPANLLTADRTLTVDANTNNIPDGWTDYYAGTTTPVVSAAGTHLTTDAAAFIYCDTPVTAGQWYSASVLMEAKSGGSNIVKIEWYDAGSGLVDYGYNIFPATPGAEALRSFSMVAPVGAVTARMACGIDGGGGEIWMRQARLENTQTPSARTDTPPWTGPH